MTDAVDVLEDDGSDPVVNELGSFIVAMNEDEQIDLVTLTWLGRGDGTIDDWNDLRARAVEARAEYRSPRRETAHYLLGEPMLGDLLADGLDEFGIDWSDEPDDATSHNPQRAQSTITVPSLSPFSTATWACAVSDSANCAATLWIRGPAASHFEMSACAAASSARRQREQHQRAQRDAFLHQFAHRHNRCCGCRWWRRPRSSNSPPSTSAWSRCCRRNRHRPRGRHRVRR